MRHVHGRNPTPYTERMTIRAPRRERAATYKTAADLAFKTEGGSEWCLVQLIRNIGDSALAGDLDAAKWLAEKLTKAAEIVDAARFQLPDGSTAQRLEAIVMAVSRGDLPVAAGKALAELLEKYTDQGELLVAQQTLERVQKQLGAGK